MQALTRLTTRTIAVVALLSCIVGVAAIGPGSAGAADVLVVGRDGIRTRSQPIPVRATRLPVPTAAAPGQEPAAPVVSISRRDAVRRSVQRAVARNQIQPTDAHHYLDVYSAARGAYRSLSGQRRSELGYVLDVTQSLANSGRLDATRMPAVFLNLKRNVEWWRKAGAPPSGKRIQFAGSRVIFQYFPGHGLQFHPLGNFGLLNGYWYEKNDSQLRSLASDLADIRVVRHGFVAWEYYFAFGGGSPPWISGMSQGTAMQALSRASN